MTISSFVGLDPLQTTETRRGIVSSRVALLLRSAEIQPPRSLTGLENLSKFPPHPKLRVGPSLDPGAPKVNGLVAREWLQPNVRCHVAPSQWHMFVPACIHNIGKVEA